MEIPQELQGSVDISNIIWMPDKVIRKVIGNVRRNFKESYEEEREVSMGKVISDYSIGDTRVGVCDYIPAIQLRAGSIIELERASDYLGLPYVNGSVHRPDLERERLAKLNRGVLITG